MVHNVAFFAAMQDCFLPFWNRVTLIDPQYWTKLSIRRTAKLLPAIFQCASIWFSCLSILSYIFCKISNQSFPNSDLQKRRFLLPKKRGKCYCLRKVESRSRRKNFFTISMHYYFLWKESQLFPPFPLQYAHTPKLL